MKITFKRIDHIQITLPKGREDDARNFYSGILGLEETDKPESLKASGGVWFKIAEAELHLGVEDSQKSKRHPAFEINDIDNVKAYLKSKGIEIKEEIPIPGRKRFSFFDPFGNRIELLEYIDFAGI